MSLGADPKISAPDPATVGANYQQLLTQLYSSAPGQFQEQADFQPQYTDLGLQNLNLELGGDGNNPGLLSMYGGSVVPAITNSQVGANATTAAGNVKNLLTMGPAASAGVSAINPGQSKLINDITGTADKNLQLGTDLDPETLDTTLNAVNQNWSDRGLGTAPAAQLSSAMQLYAGGQNLLAQRESEAENAATTSYNTTVAPITNLLTPNSNATSQALSLTNSGQSISSNAGPTLYNTGDLESLMNTVYNQQAASNISQANDEAGITSSIIGGVAGMGGSM